MIYSIPTLSESLMQGDMVQECPIVYWDSASLNDEPESDSSSVSVLVLTQSCDLTNAKSNRILVAVVHTVQDLVQRGVLQPKLIRDQIRMHRVYGWYFLPAGPQVEESIVDLRDLHTLPRALLEGLIRQGKRYARMTTPYREHLAQHFATTYSRIALPEPYDTVAEQP